MIISIPALTNSPKGGVSSTGNWRYVQSVVSGLVDTGRDCRGIVDGPAAERVGLHRRLLQWF